MSSTLISMATKEPSWIESPTKNVRVNKKPKSKSPSLGQFFMKTVNNKAAVKDMEDSSMKTEETLSTLESMMSQSLSRIEDVIGDILNESSSSLNLNEKLKRRNSLRDSERSDFSKEDLEDEDTEKTEDTEMTMDSLFSEASLKLDYMLERKDSVASEASSEYSLFSETEEDELREALFDAEREESRTHNEMVMANVNKISMDLEATRKSEAELKCKLDKLRDHLAQRRALRERISINVVERNVVVQPKTEEEPAVDEIGVVENVVEENETDDDDEANVETSTPRQSWFSSLRANRRKVKQEPPKMYAELPSANRGANGLVTKMQTFVKNKHKQRNENRGYAPGAPTPKVRRSFFPRNRVLFPV